MMDTAAASSPMHRHGRGKGLLQLAAEAWQQEPWTSGKSLEHLLQHLDLLASNGHQAASGLAAGAQSSETRPSTPAQQLVQAHSTLPATPVYPHAHTLDSVPTPYSSTGHPSKQPPQHAQQPAGPAGNHVAPQLQEQHQVVTVHLVGPSVTHHVQVMVPPPHQTPSSMSAGTPPTRAVNAAATTTHHKQPICSILLPPDAPPSIQVLPPHGSSFAPLTVTLQPPPYTQQGAFTHAGGGPSQRQQYQTDPQATFKQQHAQHQKQPSQRGRQHHSSIHGKDRDSASHGDGTMAHLDPADIPQGMQNNCIPPATAEWQQGVDSALLAAAHVADELLACVMAMNHEWWRLDAREQELQADTAALLLRIQQLTKEGGGDRTKARKQDAQLQVRKQQGELGQSSASAREPGQGMQVQQARARAKQKPEPTGKQEPCLHTDAVAQAMSTHQQQAAADQTEAGLAKSLGDTWQQNRTSATSGADSTPRYRRVWPVTTSPTTPRYAPVHAPGSVLSNVVHSPPAVLDSREATHRARDITGLAVRLSDKFGGAYDDWTASAKLKQRGKAAASQISLAGRLAAEARRNLRIAPCASIAAQADAAHGHRSRRQRSHAAAAACRQTFRQWLKAQKGQKQVEIGKGQHNESTDVRVIELDH